MLDLMNQPISAARDRGLLTIGQTAQWKLARRRPPIPCVTSHTAQRVGRQKLRGPTMKE